MAEPRQRVQINVSAEPETITLLRTLTDRLCRMPITMRGPGTYTYQTRRTYSQGEVVAMALAALAHELESVTATTALVIESGLAETGGNADRERALRGAHGDVEPRKHAIADPAAAE